MAVDIAWYQSLPRKHSSAAVVLRNHLNDILLVKPTYRDHWQLAGGIIEDGESPREAGLREVHEELGLIINNISLRVIDYLRDDVLGDSYQMVFDGDVLTDEQIASIKLDHDELAEYGFFNQEKGEPLLSHKGLKRMKSLWGKAVQNDVRYLENGIQV